MFRKHWILASTLLLSFPSISSSSSGVRERRLRGGMGGGAINGINGNGGRGGIINCGCGEFGGTRI